MITGKQYAEGLFSSASDEWETPQDLFEALDEEFHFNLDAAASDSNHKCGEYYTIKDNALQKSWGGAGVAKSTIWQEAPAFCKKSL